MAAELKLLTISDIKSKINAEFTSINPDVDPTVDKWTDGSFTGNAAAIAAAQAPIQDLLKQFFFMTAEKEFLDLAGQYEIIPRKEDTGAFGLVSQSGDSGTVIDIDTQYKSADNIQYSVLQTNVVTEQTIVIVSITRLNSTATVTTDQTHNLSNNQEVTISGSDQTEYNIAASIVVTDYNQFTYEVSGAPITPATGTMFVTSTFAAINIQATTTGLETNLENGAQLTLIDEITGISQPAVVPFGGLSGGANEENDDDYKGRLLLSRSSIAGVFSADQIEAAALTIAGNTRAFVISPTGAILPDFPVPGEVFIYPLRDNDASILPNATIREATKQAIIDQAQITANTSESDIYVLAAQLKIVDFTFINISPNTPTMQTAIKDTLKAFFEDTTSFGADIKEDSYRGAIQNTQDRVLNVFIDSFQLLVSGDIPVAINELPILGEVVFT